MKLAEVVGPFERNVGTGNHKRMRAKRRVAMSRTERDKAAGGLVTSLVERSIKGC